MKPGDVNVALMRLAVSAYEQALADGYPKRAGNTARGARSEVARRLGWDGMTVDHVLRRARRELGLEPDQELYRKPDPSAQISVADHEREVARHGRDLASLRSSLNAERKVIERIEGELEDWRGFSPRAGTAPPIDAAPAKASKGDHIPELFFSDFQFGEVIREEELDYPNAFSPEIGVARYKMLIEKTLELCFQHGAERSYPAIVYARGGDMISGGIHAELAETEPLTPIEQAEAVTDLEIAGIRALLENFPRVIIPSCFGNHGRDTDKPRSKRYSAHNYELMILSTLKREFRGDDRVCFIDGPSGDAMYAIYGRNLYLTHGDRIGSRGGQGFIGAAATVLRGMRKTLAEQNRSGRTVHSMRVGHFHTALDLGVGYCNGSMSGYSEYAKSLRLDPEPPQQWLLFHHPRRGVIDQRKIILADLPPPPPSAFEVIDRGLEGAA
jgi:hypothetical protein